MTEKDVNSEKGRSVKSSPMSISGYILETLYNGFFRREIEPGELKSIDSTYNSSSIPLGEELWGLFVPGDRSESGKDEVYTNKNLSPENKEFAYNHEVGHYLVKYFQDLGLIGGIPEKEEESLVNIYAHGNIDEFARMLQKYGLPEDFDVGRLLKHSLKKYGRDN